MCHALKFLMSKTNAIRFLAKIDPRLVDAFGRHNMVGRSEMSWLVRKCRDHFLNPSNDIFLESKPYMQQSNLWRVWIFNVFELLCTDRSQSVSVTFPTVMPRRRRRQPEPDYARQCTRCRQPQVDLWTHCADCKDPERNYDADGQSHGRQRLHNGVVERRYHGDAERIILPNGDVWAYDERGTLLSTRNVQGVILWTPTTEASHDDDSDSSHE